MVTLTVGKNSYGTLAEAGTYLDGSLRAATLWLGVAPDDQRRSLISAYRLIERQVFTGTATGVEIVDLASIAAGGSGYAVGDMLTVAGGTYGEPAVARVLTVSAGVVLTVELLHAGTYTATPSPPASTTGGSGAGCTLTLTFMDQVSDMPRTGLVDCDGDALGSTTYPAMVKEAQFELAFSMTQDEALEVAGSTGSNIKSVKAGEVAVDFFRPEIGLDRFPPQVQELLGCLLASSGSSASILGGSRGGDGNVSIFDGYPGSYDLSRGF